MDEYQELALYEVRQRADYDDAEYFASKGMAAFYGEQVLPEAVETRDVPEAAADELAEARAQLLAIIYSGGRELRPEQSARCQAAFDCWIVAAEESGDPTRTTQCRARHYACMTEIAARPVEPPPPAVREFVIAFAGGTSRLDEAARTALAEVVEQAQRDVSLAISLVGHTDSRGLRASNLQLSIRRAEAVRDALIDAGVDPERIRLEGRGEADSAAATGNGVRDEAWRKVVIDLS